MSVSFGVSAEEELEVVLNALHRHSRARNVSQEDKDIALMLIDYMISKIRGQKTWAKKYERLYRRKDEWQSPS